MFYHMCFRVKNKAGGEVSEEQSDACERYVAEKVGEGMWRLNSNIKKKITSANSSRDKSLMVQSFFPLQIEPNYKIFVQRY